MALILFDRFTYEDYSNGKTFQVSLFYDNAADGAISVKVVDTLDGSEIVPPATLDKSTTDRTWNLHDIILNPCIGADGFIYRAVYDLPFAYVEKEFNATYCNATPPPDGCNLEVIRIDVTNETAQGANDGTATVIYSTTNNPVQFALDAEPLGTANPITGISPGTHVITTRDALGCENRQSIKVTRFRQVLMETPERNLSLNNVSRWTAVFNPAIFKYQRKDYFVSYVRTIYSVFVIVYVDEVLNAEQLKDFAAGKQSYVKTDIYDFTAESAGIFYDDRPGQTGIVFSTPLKGIDTSIGFLNAIADKPGYRFATEITYGFEEVKYTYIARHSPNRQGLAVADVARYLKPEMAARDEFLYNVRNWRDLNLCASYSIRYRAEWEDGQDNWQSITAPFYVTFSALQIGNPYGSNMAAYVPFADEPNPAKKAKFMQEFKKPIFYAGMPFDLAFIYSEQMLGRQLYVRQTPLINGVASGGPITTFLLNEDSSFLLNEDTSKLVIERGDQAITDLLGVNRLILDNVYPPGTQEVGVYLYYLNGSTEIRVTEILQLQFKEKPDCGEYRYIKWLNPIGGWSYAMFEHRITLDVETNEQVIIKRYIEDYANADTTDDIVSVQQRYKETVGREGVSNADLKVLHSIFGAVKTYLYAPETPKKWITILPVPKSGNVSNTKDNFNRFEFTYKLPELNLQHQ